MGEGNDKQTNLQSRDATNHRLHPNPPYIQPWGHRKCGNLQCVLSLAHGKAVRSFLLLEIRQDDTWKITKEDPQNISSMEHPAFRSKFLLQELDVLQEGGPLLL